MRDIALGAILASCAQLGPAAVVSDTPIDTDDRTSRAAPRGHAIVQIASEPSSLDTLVANQSAATRIVSDQVYESLVSADPRENDRFVPRPALAVTWTTSADGRTMTFDLRRDVEWHDGRPFNARDVIATIDRARASSSGFRAYLTELESYRAPDAHTVVLVWRAPYFMILPVLSLLPIQPAHVIEGLGDASSTVLERRPVGTGPWRLAEWREGDRIVLEANPRHWGAGTRLERVELRVVRDGDTLTELVERGEIDVVTEILGDVEAAAAAHRFRRVEIEDNTMFWIGWNNERHAFQDARVRRAMAHMIDWARVEAMGGPRTRRTCFFAARPGEEDDPCGDGSTLPYDPREAARLLDEAGLVARAGGRRFEFELVTSELMESTYSLEALRDSLAPLGVRMRVTALPWSALVTRIREGAFDACLLTWSEPLPATDPAQVFHSDEAGGDNLVRFRNPAADTIMELARQTVDDRARSALFRDLTRILREEQPVTLLESSRRVALVSPELTDVRPTLRGWRYDQWVRASPSLERAAE